jgi:hypothetical protein
MDGLFTLGNAYRAALADHGYNSTWTRDAETAFSLDEWWDTAQSSEIPDQQIFIYDGTRILRQGADIQDQKLVIYRAATRCASCDRFLQQDRDQYESRRSEASSESSPSYCVRCLSGGVIGPHLFRQN